MIEMQTYDYTTSFDTNPHRQSEFFAKRQTSANSVDSESEEAVDVDIG
jgi:hypothetical protein